jgi:hypothetical protein
MFKGYVLFIVIAIFFWTTSFTSLKDGIFARRKFGIVTDKFALNEIWSIIVNPAPMWTFYSKHIVILRKNGKSVIVAPERMDDFLAVLRREAPQAEFKL